MMMGIMPGDAAHHRPFQTPFALGRAGAEQHCQNQPIVSVFMEILSKKEVQPLSTIALVALTRFHLGLGMLFAVRRQ
jgi:hypothetical protein